jgi:formamidopyrimidine-DNA glycosylase
LEGRTILRIERKAKYILISLSGDLVWMVHLGMSGKLVHVDSRRAKQKHDHILVRLDNGWELRYHDPRRFGLSLVAPAKDLHHLPQLKRLGLDPFDAQFTGSYLHAFTKKSDRRIRDLLLDQQIVAGIGNIYANEILSRVGVRPTTRSRRLRRSRVEAIAAMIPEVLQEAIRWCGTLTREQCETYIRVHHRYDIVVQSSEPLTPTTVPRRMHVDAGNTGAEIECSNTGL